MPERVKEQSCFMFRSMLDGEILQLKQSKESGIEVYKRKSRIWKVFDYYESWIYLLITGWFY